MSTYVEYCGGERRHWVYNFVYKRCNGALKGMIDVKWRLRYADCRGGGPNLRGGREL